MTAGTETPAPASRSAGALPGWAAVALVAALYYAAARLGLLLAFEKSNASPVWPPSGLTFALVLLGPASTCRYAGKLFGVFQRLHRAEEYEGTGVGWHLCSASFTATVGASGPTPTSITVPRFISPSNRNPNHE